MPARETEIEVVIRLAREFNDATLAAARAGRDLRLAITCVAATECLGTREAWSWIEVLCDD